MVFVELVVVVVADAVIFLSTVVVVVVFVELVVVVVVDAVIFLSAVVAVVVFVLLFLHRLVGLVVKASASRAEDPGFESRLRRDFFGVESYQ